MSIFSPTWKFRLILTNQPLNLYSQFFLSSYSLDSGLTFSSRRAEGSVMSCILHLQSFWTWWPASQQTLWSSWSTWSPQSIQIYSCPSCWEQPTNNNLPTLPLPVRRWSVFTYTSSVPTSLHTYTPMNTCYFTTTWLLTFSSFRDWGHFADLLTISIGLF